MNRDNFIKASQEEVLALGHEFTQEEIKVAMKAFSNVIEKVVVDGDKVKFGDLCAFEAKDTKARVGHNPKNIEEKINIPASRRVKVTVAKGFKEAVKA